MGTKVFSNAGLSQARSVQVRIMVDRDELLVRLSHFRQLWVNGLAPTDDMSAVTIDLNLFFDDLINILGLAESE